MQRCVIFEMIVNFVLVVVKICYFFNSSKSVVVGIVFNDEVFVICFI